MRKVFIPIIFVLMLIGLFSCTGYKSVFYNFKDENNIIYENENKSIRLEMGIKISSFGRLYVSFNEESYSFVVRYLSYLDTLNVYIDPIESEESIYILRLNFKSINPIQIDRDVMYLTSKHSQGNDFEHEIFTGFDVELHRVYDQEVYPLNYYRNKWTSLDNEIEFINNDIEAYYDNIINGKVGSVSVWISFESNYFTIQSIDDSSIVLEGTYSFDGLNIVLEPNELYLDYQSNIVLYFTIYNQ